jgi:hypothetical protein
MNIDTPCVQSPPVPTGNVAQLIGNTGEAEPNGSPAQTAPNVSG